MPVDFGANVLFSRDPAHPAAVALRTLEAFDELFAIHAAIAYHNAHDLALRLAYRRQGDARFIDQGVKNPWRQLEELEQLAELVHLCDGVFMIPPLGGNRFFGFGALALER